MPNITFIICAIIQFFHRNGLHGKILRNSLLSINLLLVSSTLSLAAIKFEEVPIDAGKVFSGYFTYGASWGDFNADGWPDLWVGNHFMKPALYLNLQDGSFANIIGNVWPTNHKTDTHGAAWADFDNDGDQDLIALTGASFGKGSEANHLFVNEDGLLRDEAVRLGLDYPLGRGRTPMWFDADLDGRLDVLLMNGIRPDRKAPTALFLQKSNGFEEYKFIYSEKRSLLDKIIESVRWRLYKFIPLEFLSGKTFITGQTKFAQLADLLGDGELDLILYYGRMRLYSLKVKPFEEFTNKIGYPNVNNLQDVAIEDFDGDSELDMYITRANRPHWRSDIIQVNPFELKGRFAIRSKIKEKTEFRELHFQTYGEVHFEIGPWQTSLSKVNIGSSRQHPQSRSFSLKPQNSSVRGSISSAELDEGEMSIDYTPDSHVWNLRSRMDELNFIVKSSKPIDEVWTTGFEPNKGKAVDSLLIRRDDVFKNKPLTGEVGIPTVCHSVVAGDFDNDMDMDLYLVCSGPVGNLPNLLYENDGKGNFSVVPDAGGAAGSKIGKGESVVTADYNRDGFLDLFVTNGKDPPLFAMGPHQLFRNQGNENHWIEIDLEGATSNRDGIGARIVLEAGGIEQVREQRGGMHRCSQNHMRIHFGLGENTKVDKIVIHWPSGILQTIDNTNADQILRAKEPL